MDYEKKYKNALTIARSRFKIEKDESVLTCLGMMFPELRESEDERIRKEMISFLRSPFIKENLTDEKVAPWLSYLEKQKEQKPAEWEDYKDKVNIPYCSSEPEWSEEDKKMRNLAIEWAETMYGQFRFVDMGSTDFRKIVAWLKSLRPSWKPSEDQMDALKELIDDAHRDGWVTPGATELYEQLKKL